jgi:hypothetical protein
VRNLLRGLLGDQIARRPHADQRHLLDVHHRVLISRDVDEVWRELVAPSGDPSAGEGLVVVPLPLGDDASSVALASLWRRSNGRLRAGLAEVVTADGGGHFVTRSVDPPGPITVTTTCLATEGGCLVEQRLEGSAPSHAGERVAEFALLWLQCGLIGLKERLEADPVSVTGSGGQPGGEGYAGRLAAELGALDASVVQSGLVPVSHEDTIEVAVPPEQLWDLLTDPGVEHLLRPATRSVTAVDVPGVAHDVLVALHDDGSGGLSLTASHLAERHPAERILERSLTSEFEVAVVTQIEPTGHGSRLTEYLVGSVPAGAGSLSGAGPVVGLLRTRLEVIKNLAEAGIRPPRDPRTGFLPPGSPFPPSEPEPSAPTWAVPAPVLLPPPHLPVPLPVHRPFVDWGWQAFVLDV